MTPIEIEDLFEEAVSTLRRLPDKKPRGHFNVWPAVARTAWEIMAMESQPMKVWATPASISRMEQCFGWLLLLDPEDAKIVWMRAEKASFRVISRRFGMSKMMAWRRWAGALVLISNHLQTEARKRAENERKNSEAAKRGDQEPLRAV